MATKIIKAHTVGTKRFQNRMRRFPKETMQDVKAGLVGEAEDIMADSKENYVPVDTGNLRASGHVQQPKLAGNRISVLFGYGGPAAPYALAVHENPRSGKTGGVSPSGHRYKTWAKVGQWKYLETPFKEALEGFPQRMKNVLRNRLRMRMTGVPFKSKR